MLLMGMRDKEREEGPRALVSVVSLFLLCTHEPRFTTQKHTFCAFQFCAFRVTRELYRYAVLLYS